MPKQCRGETYRVFDSSGNTVKDVGPPLTPEQKAELIAEEKRQARLEEANREQRRKDQALLDTYATREDIDLSQKKAEGDLHLVIKDAQTALLGLTEKRKAFELEAEFYKSKTMPPQLAKDLRTIDHEIKLQNELIDLKNQEFKTVREKYGADRQRYDIITKGRNKPSSSRPR